LIAFYAAFIAVRLSLTQHPRSAVVVIAMVKKKPQRPTLRKRA
jgi:hypothetical protein